MTLDYNEYSERQTKLMEKQIHDDKVERFVPTYEDESFLDLMRRLDGCDVEPIMLPAELVSEEYEPEERRDWR